MATKATTERALLASCCQCMAEGVPGVEGLRGNLPGREGPPPRGRRRDSSYRATELTDCEFCKSSSLLEVAKASCFMPGQCSTSARAKKPCGHLHCVPSCAPESSAFF